MYYFEGGGYFSYNLTVFLPQKNYNFLLKKKSTYTTLLQKCRIVVETNEQ